MLLPLSLLSLCSVAAATYDYIIVGGGTSGLVVANRLSEDSSVSVLVVEAGDSVYNNPNVTGTGAYGAAFGTSIDWAYQTANQTYAGDLTQTIRAGKALGGTSTINGMAYTRAEDVQIDAWEAIGNQGWNWSTLFPYYLKSEQFQIPTSAQSAAGANWNPAYHGMNGPLMTGWTYEMMNGSMAEVLNTTYQNLGISYLPDVNGGKMHGYTLFPRTVNRALDVREDAARAYYYPFESSRPNLSVMLNTYGNRIVWANATNTEGSVTATGVEVTLSNGTVQTIQANKEVILSAGSLISPVILERSGVGNPTVLSRFGIPLVVNLTTVGENLQDQMNTEFIYLSNATFSGQPTFLGHPTAADLFGRNITNVANSVQSSLPQYAAAVSKASNGTMSTAVLQRLFRLQYNIIFNNPTPIAEILVAPSGSKFITEYWALLPFARGNVHIGSANPLDRPVINPNYMMLEWDMQEQIASGKFVRKLYETAPFTNWTTGEAAPGYSTLPVNATDDQWAQWISSVSRSNFHPVGTAAMMPRDMGGVVDSNLVVYGTNNVRVVDASILPLQVCGHLVSTLYAVAERASDLIKAGQV